LGSILNGSTKSLANKAHPVRGYLYVATATLLWGVAATLGRAAFTGRLLPAGQRLQIDPLILSQSRTSFSFLVLLPILIVQRGWRSLKLPAADFGRLMLLGVVGVAASNYFYYLAIQKTNVATAIILQYTAPVLVLLYMVARGLQKATVQRVSAVALAVAGSALAIGVVGTGGLRLNPVGVTAGMLAAVSFSFYNVGGHNILARYVEGGGGALLRYGVGLLASVRSGFGSSAVFALLCGTAAPGADARDGLELPGAGILDRDCGCGIE
jgi:drug/metabolite transporter (DMT)-like permease